MAMRLAIFYRCTKRCGDRLFVELLLARHERHEHIEDPRTPSLSSSDLRSSQHKAIEASPAGVALVVHSDGRLRGIIEAQFLLHGVLRADESATEGWLWQALVQSSGQVLRILRGFTPAAPLAESRMARLPGCTLPGCTLPADMPLSAGLVRLISAEAFGHVGVVVASDGRPQGILWRSHALRTLVHG